MTKDNSISKNIKAWCEGGSEDFPTGEFFGLAPEERESCLKEIVRRGRADLLTVLKERAGSAGEAKSIRRALHRLRSRGVRVEEKPEERTFVVPAREKSPQELAFCTPMGAAGDQAVWLWRSHQGSSLMFQVFVADQQGFIDLIPARISRSKFERMIEEMRKKAKKTPIIEIPPDHARWLISRAEQKARNTGRPLPEGYSEAKSIIGALPSSDEKHPVLEKLDVEDIRNRPGLLYDAAGLLDHPVFHGWYFGKDAVESCKFKLQEADASPLVMNEVQKKERMERIFEEEARKAVVEEGLDLWQGRLLENAYFLDLKGEKEKAEQAAAVALSLDDENIPPLFTAVMRRSFEAEPEEKRRDGKIIIP